ncbi:MAG TPA: 30S ribosomal protein S18 [Candidatus Moranbacteria bacterium]|nr:30S ribosomal protein S18 [Candidatus Moranbacteria bacterium]
MNNLKEVKKSCYFCQEKIDKVDYKDTELLRRFINSQGKIYPPRRFGNCAKHQRMVTSAIKRSRIMGMTPFVIK